MNMHAQKRTSLDNHDEDKPALNSIADNTVAMEVT